MWEPVDDDAVSLVARTSRVVGVWGAAGFAIGLIWNPAGVVTLMVTTGPGLVGLSAGYGWQGVGTFRIENDLMALSVVCMGLVGVAWGRRTIQQGDDVPLDAAVWA